MRLNLGGEAGVRQKGERGVSRRGESGAKTRERMVYFQWKIYCNPLF